MSAPAEKARSPAPVTTMARTSSSCFRSAKSVEQLPAHGIVLGIEGGGAVERDRDDVVLPVDDDRLVRHAGRSFPTTTRRRARSAMSASA